MVLLGGKTNVEEARDGTMDLVTSLTCPSSDNSNSSQSFINRTVSSVSAHLSEWSEDKVARSSKTLERRGGQLETC